jgi:Fe2+/Zn2+ uptake regulation proteins
MAAKEKDNIWPAGVKRTKQREGVLSVLMNSDKPMSAAEIYKKMETGNQTAWLSTVYRVLELFVKENIAAKINMMNNEMAVYELNRFKHKHYAVCMNCHKIIEIENCPMEKFIPIIEDDDFRVVGHNLEIYGLCKDCNHN